jgi:hypothetical protein
MRSPPQYEHLHRKRKKDNRKPCFPKPKNLIKIVARIMLFRRAHVWTSAGGKTGDRSIKKKKERRNLSQNRGSDADPMIIMVCLEIKGSPELNLYYSKHPSASPCC